MSVVLDGVGRGFGWWLVVSDRWVWFQSVSFVVLVGGGWSVIGECGFGWCRSWVWSLHCRPWIQLASVVLSVTVGCGFSRWSVNGRCGFGWCRTDTVGCGFGQCQFLVLLVLFSIIFIGYHFGWYQL